MVIALLMIITLLAFNLLTIKENEELKTINEHLKTSNNEFAKMLAEYDPSLKEYLESKKVK